MDEREDIPLPADLVAEETARFRRRARLVPVARRRAFRLRTGLKWLAMVVVVLATWYGADHLADLARTSERSVLAPSDDVRVSGNHFVSADEVASALGRTMPSGDRRNESEDALGLSLAEESRRVASIPWVRSATIMRVYPHRLLVKIVERTPLAFVNVGGQVKMVDAEGVLLEKPENARFDFPVLEGLDALASRADRQARLAVYEEFSHELAGQWPTSGWLLSEVALSDPEDLKALLVQGKDTILIHFGHEDFGNRFRTFLTLLPEVRKTSPRIDSVDLRYQGQLVVNPEEP